VGGYAMDVWKDMGMTAVWDFRKKIEQSAVPFGFQRFQLIESLFDHYVDFEDIGSNPILFYRKVV
jgi:hypothetical protein